MGGWFHRMRARIRCRRFEDDLAEELEFHRTMTEHALQSAGTPPDESRWRARRELGNVMLAREDARAVWVAPWLDSAWQDVRYGLRALRKHPGFAFTSFITLVLGIGVNVALFTVFNAVALQPWPVASPRSLVQVWPWPDARGRTSVISPEEYEFLRDGTRRLSGLAAFVTRTTEVEGEAASTTTAFVSPNFFSVLGVGFERGRGFAPGDNSGPATAIISGAMWRSRFRSDPRILGRQIRIDGRPFLVVGVTEPSFSGPHSRWSTELYLPLAALTALHPAETLEAVNVAGRLARGSGREEARIELETLSSRFRKASSLDARPFRISGTSPIEQPNEWSGLRELALILVAALSVLLVACSNIGSLQLARALGRHREIAIRLAIGASRARVVRQLITETAVMAVAAGAVASSVACLLPRPVLRALGSPAALVSSVHPDAMVFAFSAAATALAALVAGLAPALQATRAGGLRALQETSGSTRTQMPVRTILLAAQVAICVALLVGAGLLTRAVSSALTSPFDLRIDDVVVAQVLPGAELRGAKADQRVRALLDALESAGFSHIGVAEAAPIRFNSVRMRLRLPGEAEATYRSVPHRPVSGGYFDVLGIPIVAGRSFTRHSPTLREAIVNQALAKTCWSGRSALGASLIDGRTGTVYTVVGVSRDSHDVALRTPSPTVYTATSADRWSTLLVRGKPEETIGKLRGLASSLDPTLRLSAVPLRSLVHNELAIPMLGAGIGWAVALLAVTLALVGVSGVFAYVVEERRREIAIRLALGARAAQVVGLIVGQTRAATVGGLAAGLLLSLGVGRLLGAYLFGVSPLDPVAYGAIVAALALCAFVAAYVPARRAARVDPAVTLRFE